MRFIGISAEAFGIGEDGIGEVIVFVDKEVYLLSDTFAYLIEELQLRYGSVFGVQFFPCLRREEVGIFLAKAFDGGAAVFIQPFAVIIQLSADTGEVKIEHQVTVAVWCGVLPDIETTKEFIELVARAHIVVVLQYVQRQAFAEASWADKKEERVL